MISIKIVLFGYLISIIFIFSALSEIKKIQKIDFLSERQNNRLDYLRQLKWAGILVLFLSVYYTYKYFLGS